MASRTALVWGIEDGKSFTSVTTALHEAEEREFISLAQAGCGRSERCHTGEAARSAYRTVRIALHRRTRQDAAGGNRAAGKRRAVQRCDRRRRCREERHAQAACGGMAEQGRDVHGASLAWRQADELTDAGIGQRNVAAFSVMIDRLRSGDMKLTEKSVVAVDEFGLLGTRQGLELLRLREKLGFSVVALGDDKQCESVQAGAIIESIPARSGC